MNSISGQKNLSRKTEQQMFKIQIIGRYVKMTQLTLDKKYIINTLYNELGEKINENKFKKI